MSSIFSEVEVRPLQRPAGNLKANGSVLIGNVVKVNFTVSDGRNGLWVKLPQRSYQTKDKDTQEQVTRWVREVKITDENLEKELSQLVLAEYTKATSQSEAGESSQQTRKPNF